MDKRKHYVVIGATSAIAEHCARLWMSKGGIDISLVGRDAGRLERVAADLRVRGPASTIGVYQADFLNPDAISRLVDEVVARQAVDVVLIAHGMLSEQSDCQSNLNLCNETLQINGVSPVLYAEAFAGYFEHTGRGTLALIGSVAGDRGRKSNYVYGSAKGLVARYAQGLQHRFANTGVKVVLIKPGPTETPMTAHLKAEGASLAPVESVASDIVVALDRGCSVIYAPKKWRLIMWVIRHLPVFIFNRLNI